MTINLTPSQAARLQKNAKATAQDATSEPTTPSVTQKAGGKGKVPRQRIMLLSESVWGHTLLGSKLHLWQPYSDGHRWLAACGRETSYPGFVPVYDEAMERCAEWVKGEG